MSKKLKTSIEAKKNRVRRRIAGGFGELLGSGGILCSAAFICLIFIYAYSYLLSSSYFEIRETSVRGLKELTEKEVLLLAGVKPRQNLLAVNTGLLARRISSNPWVKKIYVGRELPNRLILEVRERIPVVLVKRANHFYLMDSEGNIFKRLGKGDDVDLPILTGFRSEGKEKSDKLLVGVFDLLKIIAASGQNGYLGSISEIHLDDIFGVSLLTDAGLYLKLGAGDYASKLSKLGAVMSDLEKRGLGKGHLCIDLGDVNKVTIQRRNATGKTDAGKKGKQYRT